MNHSPELNHSIPLEVRNDVPTFAMPERNSCVPTVLRSVLGHFEPSFAVCASELDGALGRNHEEAATTESFCNFLADRGYEITSKQVWDDSEFVKDSYAYVTRFYGMDTDQPRVSTAAFEGYYTESTLERLKREAEVRLAEQELSPLEETEVGLPTYDDIKRFLADGYLVTVTLVGSEEAGTHFALVCGYTDDQDKTTLHVFSPDFHGTGVVLCERDIFDEDWMPEEGIIAMRLPERAVLK